MAAISRHHPIFILEARLLPPKRSTTATYFGETGQIPSTSVHVSTAIQDDFTNDVHRPLAPTLSRPPIRYHIHCSSAGRLCTNSCPHVVPNSMSPNPVPYAQYGIKVETSENVQEVKTARALRGQGRLAVPNSNSLNPVPHVRRGVEIEASEMRTARELREQARRFFSKFKLSGPSAAFPA